MIPNNLTLREGYSIEFCINFPAVDLKMSSLRTLALKSYNKIWYDRRHSSNH
jgi:hypothetical protein